MSRYATEVILFDVKPPFQTQGKAVRQVGRLFATSRIPLRLKHETSSLLSAKTGGGTLAISPWERNHPAMQMWMRVTAVCQKIRANADPTRTSLGSI